VRKNHKTSKKSCHAGLKLLESTTLVERDNERNSKAIMKNKLMYNKIKKASAVGHTKKKGFLASGRRGTTGSDNSCQRSEGSYRIIQS